MGKAEKERESWQELRKKIKHKWAMPFIFLEWNCERLSVLLKRWAFLEVLEHLGRLAILVAVVSYVMGANERRMQVENQRKAKHYQAWQVINTAQGQMNNAGRIDALQDLNKDMVSLIGVDISKAYLPGLNLENADLRAANLAGANLNEANISGANLRYANLAGADLWHANLAEANLHEANISGANLRYANLAGADLRDANLAEATLVGADLAEADLAGADLAGADLRDIQNWLDIRSVEYARICDVNNPPDGFIEWATEHGAVSIESDREWQDLINEKAGNNRRTRRR